MLRRNSAAARQGEAWRSGFAPGIAAAYVGIDNPYWPPMAQVPTIVMKIS
ncbi:hypothetical protein QTN24_07665 [Cupriavidus sp. SZY C1]|nr:hypothetical protein [Cupriavidus sp. SZY C1]MDT6961372.1 hypothetical protein [Cupriavidus sp. SZY C1]